MANPGMPTPEPFPGGKIPGDLPPPTEPDDLPDIGPTGPRTPYPVDDPDIDEPRGPDSEPDYLPGGPTDPGIRLSIMLRSDGIHQNAENMIDSKS